MVSHIMNARAVVGIILLVALEALGAGPGDRSAQVDALFAAVTQNPSPGAAVMVIEDGNVLHARGYGMANLEHDVANTPQTKFRLGSITKCFTATAILQLHERGRLSLDDRVGKHLSDYPHAESITIRHLLNHTSGIPGGSSKDKPLEFPPGSRISYSNTGYMLLGRIIEKVGGKSYEAVLRENIFEPLGMGDTGYDHSEIVLKRRACGYAIDVNGDVVNAEHVDMSGPFAAGGLYSTVEDLRRFDQALYGESLLRAATLKEAFAATTLTDGRAAPYGLGWMVQQHRGLDEVAHGGDITGFNSYLARFPEQCFTVIVLSNLPMRPPGPIPTAGSLAHQIADIYLADRMQPAQKTGAIEVDPETLAAYAGRYRLEGPEHIVSVTGDVLTVTCGAGTMFVEGKQGKVNLVPESEAIFRSPQYGTQITFVRGDNGRVDKMIVNLAGLMELAATRIP